MAPEGTNTDELESPPQGHLANEPTLVETRTKKSLFGRNRTDNDTTRTAKEEGRIATGLRKIRDLLQSQELEDTREPFEIRGHHLQEFAQIVHNDEQLGPEELAKKNREIMQTVLTKKIYGEPYVRDLIGTTDLDADRYEHSTAEVYKRFQGLPDDYPIILSEGQKDEVCKSCPFKGDHCLSVDISKNSQWQSYAGAEDAVKVDGLELDKFLASKSAQMRGKIEITTVIAEFNDAPPREVRRLRTNAETVREYLALDIDAEN